MRKKRKGGARNRIAGRCHAIPLPIEAHEHRNFLDRLSLRHDRIGRDILIPPAESDALRDNGSKAARDRPAAPRKPLHRRQEPPSLPAIVQVYRPGFAGGPNR